MTIEEIWRNPPDAALFQVLWPPGSFFEKTTNKPFFDIVLGSVCTEFQVSIVFLFIRRRARSYDFPTMTLLSYYFFAQSLHQLAKKFESPETKGRNLRKEYFLKRVWITECASEWNKKVTLQLKKRVLKICNKNGIKYFLGPKKYCRLSQKNKLSKIYPYEKVEILLALFL